MNFFTKSDPNFSQWIFFNGIIKYIQQQQKVSNKTTLATRIRKSKHDTLPVSNQSSHVVALLMMERDTSGPFLVSFVKAGHEIENEAGV